MSILDDISQAFDPSPLPVGSAVYVDCRAVRGGSDILVELGKKVLRSERTCQLYSGHRGGGKSTELLRLQADLDKKGCALRNLGREDEATESFNKAITLNPEYGKILKVRVAIEGRSSMIHKVSIQDACHCLTKSCDGCVTKSVSVIM